MSDLNETIRSLYTALIDADSRAEIHRSVCQALTTIDRVDAAWIGTVDHDRNVVEPAAQAHLPPEFLDDQSFSLADDRPAPEAQVADERTVVDVDRIPVGVHEEPWRNTALIHGFRSVVAVPIRHEELFYGTLTVYSTETDALDERTTRLLEEFGTLVGFVTNAVERRDAFGDDQMVDLTVDVEPGEEDVCVALASRLETTVEVGNVTRRNRNSHVLHCSIDDVDPGTVTDVVAEIPGLESIRPLSESASTAYELVVVDQCVASRAVPISALLRSIRVTPTNCQIVFSVPEYRDYQRFLEQVRDVFSAATLVAKRQASEAGSVPVPELLEASLSEKQDEALRTAYHSGYFDDDRKRTGAEIATSLGIAQPTFSKRLRSAQRDLLAAILESDSL
ncbi:hypothetical protein B1756_09030 [Natrarchaeobaculum aegyptiacum]|uniref:GAF domain-containing protein n=1 Tax=Natrarchaeobaculum aegyptiacum TaxID=745377 RepID=A0A2Z2HS06_9EURY|nr:hypothetical protein B1756_09030 [Natrarchaeobaculum aegyptiacum]